MLQFIYLVHKREFRRLDENTYKVGKMQEHTTKFPRGSQLMFLVQVCDSFTLEAEIIMLFREKYQHMEEYGRKYFSGNACEMVKDITAITSRNSCKSEDSEFMRICESCKENKSMILYSTHNAHVCAVCEDKYVTGEKEGLLTSMKRCYMCFMVKERASFESHDFICIKCRSGILTSLRQCDYCKDNKHNTEITIRDICTMGQTGCNGVGDIENQTIRKCCMCNNMKNISSFASTYGIVNPLCEPCRHIKMLSKGYQCLSCGEYKDRTNFKPSVGRYFIPNKVCNSCRTSPAPIILHKDQCTFCGEYKDISDTVLIMGKSVCKTCYHFNQTHK
jgi:hypothetical protein